MVRCGHAARVSFVVCSVILVWAYLVAFVSVSVGMEISHGKEVVSSIRSIAERVRSFFPCLVSRYLVPRVRGGISLVAVFLTLKGRSTGIASMGVTCPSTWLRVVASEGGCSR